MKIEKLYTLSQFVDEIQNNEDVLIKDLFQLVCKYNYFLKQPLNKEMFVNDTIMPEMFQPYMADMITNEWTEQEQLSINKWKEAEKKLIFESRVKNIGLGSKEIRVNKINRIGYIKDNKFNTYYKSLSDLADKTNGEMKLKNLEI